MNKSYQTYVLEIKTGKNKNWKIHVHDLASKLNRASSVLSKLKYFVSSETIRSIYFTFQLQSVAWDLYKLP